MKTIATAYAQEPEWFLSGGNGREIRELLLRKACEVCKNFATDILIFLDSNQIKGLANSDAGSVNIYFREFGVDWGFQEPSSYQYKMVLVKQGDHYTLYGD